MSRAIVALDRVVAVVLGLLLVAGGLVALAWSQAWFTSTGRLHRWRTLSDTPSLGPLPRLVRDGWWPWVAAVVGLCLLALACAWLLAHLPAGRVRRLTVSGRSTAGTGVAGAPTDGGRLTADTGTVTRAAAERLRRAPGIANARARIIRDRGELVAHFDLAAEHDTDLARVAREIDRVCAELLAVTQDRRLRARARVHLERAMDLPGGPGPA